MSLRTKFPTTEEKRELTKKLFKKHEPILKGLGVTDPLFIPKMNYYYQPLNCRVVGFFDSELSVGKDIYVEFVDRYHSPEDAHRRLYHWKYDPNYPMSLEQDTSDKRFVKYLVPVTEFRLVEESVLELPWKEDVNEPTLPKKEQKKTVENSLNDMPVSDMTVRDLFAILHRKPISQKAWLNELINDLNK